MRPAPTSRGAGQEAQGGSATQPARDPLPLPPQDPPPEPSRPAEVRGDPKAPQKKVEFQLPEGHREAPPKPARQQKVWRKLADSTTVQLRGDGVLNYPIRVVDNRPEHLRNSEPLPRGLDRIHDQHNIHHNVDSDQLVVQPRHLTQESPSSSSSSRPVSSQPQQAEALQTGGPPLYGTGDLDQQAAEAIQSGRVPPWKVEDNGPSMRSSVRVDDNSHDLSWVQGVTPRTLPPPMPLHPNTVLSMRSTATGAWRGATWSPPQGSIIQHPPRQQVEPTVVVYKTLPGNSDGEVLPDSVHMTLHPAGEWIGLNWDLLALHAFGLWL